jgi:osmotically-inducible protein OsmY
MKKHPYVRSLIASSLLLGAVAVTSITAGCAGTDKRASTGEFIDDSVITTRVKAALVKDDTTPGGAIKVDTFKGTVQLSGFVDTADQKAKAGEIARGIDGVREVVNNITVK